MRYAQGGGLTDAERAARERIRLQAVERFEGAERNREIAAALSNLGTDRPDPGRPGSRPGLRTGVDGGYDLL
ncbi:hypothetical protein [Streptomyces litmocidini]|uniref:Uncharacterized protein n=1 Tax=Streptomyces litmocidini TaxID=67318 RepID=A0ABW7UD58_9ACTN